jgi:hypothetical protein
MQVISIKLEPFIIRTFVISRESLMDKKKTKNARAVKTEDITSESKMEKRTDSFSLFPRSNSVAPYPTKRRIKVTPGVMLSKPVVKLSEEPATLISNIPFTAESNESMFSPLRKTLIRKSVSFEKKQNTNKSLKKSREGAESKHLIPEDVSSINVFNPEDKLSIDEKELMKEPVIVLKNNNDNISDEEKKKKPKVNYRKSAPEIGIRKKDLINEKAILNESNNIKQEVDEEKKFKLRNEKIKEGMPRSVLKRFSLPKVKQLII